MEPVIKSSGNVFEDLGFDIDEALNLKLRAELMRDIELAINELHLTQADAAKKIGVTQSRVSDLVRGKVDRFSLDALVNMLAKIGREVHMVVSVRAA